VASIHKASSGTNTPYFRMSFRGPDGKQILRSTKTTDERQAFEIAAKAERGAEHLAIFKDQAAAHVAMEELVSALQQAASGKLDQNLVRSMLSRLLSLTNQPQEADHTIEASLQKWVALKETSNARGTYLRYRETIKDFLTMLGNRAVLPLDQLSVDDVEAFQQLQLREGKSRASANESVKILRAACGYLRRKGHVLKNVAEAVDLLDQDSVGKKPFTPEQVSRLLAAADDEWKGMIIVGYCTGARITDAARLKWENVDLAKKTLTYRQSKTKHAGVRPITTVMLPDLHAYLTARWPKRQSPYLFPSLHDKKTSSNGGLSALFTRLMAKADIENETLRTGGTGKGRAFFAYGFHSFRHTVVATLENLGVSEEIRMLHVGHTSAAHSRYSHREVESIRQSLQAFPSLFRHTAKKAGTS